MNIQCGRKRSLGMCVGLGLTKKQAREKLNVNLQYYNLKLLANGEIKEI